MKNQRSNLARVFTVGAALATLALLPSELGAEDLSSASFRLRGGTLSGGGEVGLQSSSPTPAIGSGG